MGTGIMLETERLVLRPVIAEDYEALLAYQSRPDVTRFLLWDPRTPGEVRAALDRKIVSTTVDAEGDVLALAIVRRDTAAMIGDVILALISEADRTGELGYIIHPDHQGSGFATEAGSALLAHAFDTLGLHRVIGRVEARHTASARVLEKLGMRREACFVENGFVKGEWQSELVYAILEREWRAAHDGS